MGFEAATQVYSKEHSAYQDCTKCICDTSIKGIKFDSNGECNFCALHNALEKECPIDGGKLQKIIDEIKRCKTPGRFDCIVGVSGGRDSIYSLYLVKKVFNLNPLAVHFNDGFGNPTAGENIQKAAQALGVETRTITSDWRESKDLKIAFLKASTPDLEEGTDLGIATALYGVACSEKIRFVFFGQSFRTEGISPLSWNYLDGRYLRDVHRHYGEHSLRSWRPTDPGFNLGLMELIYYVVLKRIRTIPLLYYVDYQRDRAQQVIEEKCGWVDTGAHYFDDLYQSLMTYVLRKKFGIDRRIFNYSALVRSGQMTRESALEKVGKVSVIEDEKVITLCIKRLGLSQEDFEKLMAVPPKTFRDYRSNYFLIRCSKLIIKAMCKVGWLPSSVYGKYFQAGE